MSQAGPRLLPFAFRPVAPTAMDVGMPLPCPALPALLLTVVRYPGRLRLLFSYCCSVAVAVFLLGSWLPLCALSRWAIANCQLAVGRGPLLRLPPPAHPVLPVKPMSTCPALLPTPTSSSQQFQDRVFASSRPSGLCQTRWPSLTVSGFAREQSLVLQTAQPASLTHSVCGRANPTKLFKSRDELTWILA